MPVVISPEEDTEILKEFWNGESYSDIAETHGISVKTAREVVKQNTRPKDRSQDDNKELLVEMNGKMDRISEFIKRLDEIVSEDERQKKDSKQPAAKEPVVDKKEPEKVSENQTVQKEGGWDREKFAKIARSAYTSNSNKKEEKELNPLEWLAKQFDD